MVKEKLSSSRHQEMVKPKLLKSTSLSVAILAPVFLTMFHLLQRKIKLTALQVPFHNTLVSIIGLVIQMPRVLANQPLFLMNLLPF